MSNNDVYLRSFEDLPEEIILRIFQFLLPYQDYASIRLVCRQWERLWRDVCKWRKCTFDTALSSSSSSVPIHWQLIDPPARLNLTPRFSHASCYVESNQMLYIFGGSRDLATSLNDFWRFNLSTRSWERILAIGSYPPPKCAASFIDDGNGRLLLFGGRSMVYVDDIHIREQLHSELHSYSLERNCWNLHAALNEPGPISDHSASLIGNDGMIVFGGCTITIDNQRFHQQTLSQRTNDLWLWTNIWTKIDVTGVRPEPRKGHSQFTMNSNDVLIVGGSSLTGVCRDVWLFSLLSRQWTQISVGNQYPHEFSPGGDDLSCVPFCWVPSAHVLVTFGRLKRQPTRNERFVYSQYDFSHCDNNRTSSFVLAQPPSSSSDESDETTRLRHRCSTTTTTTITNKRPVLPAVINNKYHLMDVCSGLQMYRLDLSNLFSSNPSVSWLPSRVTSVFGSPSRSSLYYSLVYTRNELVLFGGIEKKKLVRQTMRPSEKDDHPCSRPLPLSGTLAFVTISNIVL